jgi:hypothetical protein
MSRDVLPTKNQRVRFIWADNDVLPPDYGTVIDDRDLDRGYVEVKMDNTFAIDPPIFKFHISHIKVVSNED